jgi:hypothetical protein
LQFTNILQDSSEVYPGTPIISFDKLKSLMNTFSNWGLCQDMSLMALKSMPILQQLLNAVLTHTRSENIHWASPLNSLRTCIDDYEDCPFIILTTAHISRDRSYHTLIPVCCATYGITISKLKTSLKQISHPSQHDRKLIMLCMYFDISDMVLVASLQAPL